MNPISIGLLVFGLIIAGSAFLSLINIYNGLVALRNEVERAWVNIDVILKQRHDELPQLVSVIEQFAQYERGTFTKLAEARTRYGSAGNMNDKVKAAADVSSALRGILAIGEAYPELKSSEQFAHFQERISGLEGQIADRRELFNDTVTRFNTRIQQVPDVFFVSMLGYSKLDLYRVAEADKAIPNIKMKIPA